MKAFYLAGSVLMTAIILILAFENIQAMCSDVVFFFHEVETSTPPTFTILFEALLGIIAGVFYTKFIGSLGASDEDEDEDY